MEIFEVMFVELRKVAWMKAAEYAIESLNAIEYVLREMKDDEEFVAFERDKLIKAANLLISAIAEIHGCIVIPEEEQDEEYRETEQGFKDHIEVMRARLDEYAN